jgi:hypothetical protein
VTAEHHPSLLRNSTTATAVVGVVLALAPAAVAGGIAPDPSPRATPAAIAPDPAPRATREAPAAARPAPTPTPTPAPAVRSSAPTVVASAPSVSPPRRTVSPPVRRHVPKKRVAARPAKRARPVAPAVAASRHDETFALAPASPAAATTASRDARTPLLAGLALFALVAASLSLLGTARRLGPA